MELQPNVRRPYLRPLALLALLVMTSSITLACFEGLPGGGALPSDEEHSVWTAGGTNGLEHEQFIVTLDWYATFNWSIQNYAAGWLYPSGTFNQSQVENNLNVSNWGSLPPDAQDAFNHNISTTVEYVIVGVLKKEKLPTYQTYGCIGVAPNCPHGDHIGWTLP